MADAQEQRDYTPAELDQAVQTGSITQAQRDQIFASQVQRNAEKTARETATSIVETEARNNSLDVELKSYAELAPQIMDENNPARQRIRAEFDYLVQRGHDPKSLATELAAVRAVMGPIDRVKAYKEGKRVAPDYFGDTTGGQRQTIAQRKEDDAWSKLQPRQRQHYETMITKGVYPNRGACLAEMNWRRGGKSESRGTA